MRTKKQIEANIIELMHEYAVVTEYELTLDTPRIKPRKSSNLALGGGAAMLSAARPQHTEKPSVEVDNSTETVS